MEGLTQVVKDHFIATIVIKNSKKIETISSAQIANLYFFSTNSIRYLSHLKLCLS